jgi:hypothetical protein
MALGSSGLPPQRLSTGSAVLSTARQIGIAVGVALVVAILQSRPGVDGFHSAWIATAAVALVASAGMLTRKAS